MRRNVKIILANAPIHNGNKGCVALTISVMAILDQVFEELGCDYTLYLPDSQWYDYQKHSISIGRGKNIEYYDIKYFFGLNIKEKIRELAKKVFGVVSHNSIFKKADFVLDIGQGDSFADIYGLERFNGIDRIHKIAKKLGKPYCILPQTIGPFKDDSVKKAAHCSIANATLCMARDKQSLQYVLENIPEQKNVKEYIDVAFFMPYEQMYFEDDFTHVGLNVSGLLWNGGYTGDNQFGLKADYKNVVRSIIDYFLGLSNTKVHLIAHVVESERVAENDYAICYDLWREYNNPNLVLAPFALGPMEIKSYISGLDFFMGARMHATIGAFSAGVPVVPMAYSRKFNGLFLDTLDYPYMVDLVSLSTEEIKDSICSFFSKINTLKVAIDEARKAVIAPKKQMIVESLKRFFDDKDC